MKRAFFRHAPLLAICAASALAVRCGGPGGTGFNDGGSGDATTTDASPDSPFTQPESGPSVYSDFPSSPIVDPSLPANVATQFGAPDAGTGAAPCIAEPAADAMIPRNWTPLFLEYSAPGANVYEITVTIDNQTNPAVVYTPNPTYTFDQNLWKSVQSHSAGHDVNVSIRGGTLSGQTVSGVTLQSTSTVHIAPVDAPGSVVYWRSTSGTAFMGFTVGDMAPKTVLTPTTAGASSAGDGTTTCISCHTSSPDGTYVLYTRDTSTSRAIDARTVVGAGAPAASDVSASALALLGRDHQGAPVLTPTHYSASDAVAISIFYNPTATGSPNYEMAWTDLHALDANGWGVLTRTGDPNPGIASPSWRHDGSAIAYVSSSSAGEAVVSNGPVMDIYTVPYNNKAGGAAAPLKGASDPNYHEFYPVYSPNDTLLAFNRTDNSAASSYNQPNAEVFVVPGGGGSAQRLRANDPPVCTTLVSPGLTNSWPRWAPQAQKFGQYNYYWIIFSSKRRPATGLNPQLYVAAIVTQVNGGTETIYADYPAVYVLSQQPGENNHTPAWDNFDVQGIPN